MRHRYLKNKMTDIFDPLDDINYNSAHMYSIASLILSQITRIETKCFFLKKKNNTICEVRSSIHLAFDAFEQKTERFYPLLPCLSFLSI